MSTFIVKKVGDQIVAHEADTRDIPQAEWRGRMNRAHVRKRGLTDTWVRCNRGERQDPHRTIYPCFDLDEERAELVKRRKGAKWAIILLFALVFLSTYPIWSGH